MTLSIRAAGLRALELSGVNFLIHRLNSHKLVVLCYHGVVGRRMLKNEANFETTVSAEDFATHLEFISRWFHPVTLREVRAAYLEGKPLPPRSILITFDDGYRNVLTHGAPVLRRFGIPAAVFLSTGYIESGNLYWYDEIRQRLEQWKEPQIVMPESDSPVNWPGEDANRLVRIREIQQGCKRIPDQRRLQYLEYVRARTPEPIVLSAELHNVLDPMNWDEARSLTSMGVEIGSHTVNHPILTNLNPDELNDELTRSKAEIERQIGQPCFSIAYPNGTQADFSDAVVNATKAAGYDLAFTMVSQLNDRRSKPYSISRLAAPGHVPPAALRLRASGLHSLLSRGEES